MKISTNILGILPSNNPKKNKRYHFVLLNHNCMFIAKAHFSTASVLRGYNQNIF